MDIQQQKCQQHPQASSPRLRRHYRRRQTNKREMARTLALALLCGTAAAFGGPRRAARPRRRTALNGETVRVKFRIYPDGRVEETVSGIRGSDCTKVTEELNEKLGKVTQTKPTEEMFQEKVDVQTEVFDQNVSEW